MVPGTCNRAKRKKKKSKQLRTLRHKLPASGPIRSEPSQGKRSQGKRSQGKHGEGKQRQGKPSQEKPSLLEGDGSDSAQATSSSEKCATQQCGFNEHDSREHGLREHGLREKRYLIWAIRFDHGLPSSRGDAPREVRVRGPLNQESFSGAQAVAFIEGFNATMFAQGKPIWAVALPREFNALQYLRADIRPS